MKVLHSPPIHIRQAQADDIHKILAIYNWYILNTTITFEIEAVSPDAMAARIQEKLEHYDWLVGEVNREVVGYAYYGPFHPRPAYGHTVESSIYLHPKRVGQGLGSALYEALIGSAGSRGFRELVSLIALPNQGSTCLHEKFGFQETGILKNVGYKFDRYIDIGIWQRSIR